MKLSSISLFGAALAAIVVGAIASPVPCSLEQANLFERDVDGELVDGLFTRARLTEEQRRRQAHDHHMEMAQADRETAKEQQLASGAHQELFEKHRDSEHSDTAAKHSREDAYHRDRAVSNSEAATAALTGSRTPKQVELIANKARKMQSTEACKNEAIASRNYANAVIAGHPPPSQPYLLHRHSRFASQLDAIP